MTGVREARPGDVPALADLAELARAEYERYEPEFWRPAPTARLMHTPFLSFLVGAPDVCVLAAERGGRIEGFLAARVSPLPPALGDAGRLCVVDDFAVRRRDDWGEVGPALLEALRERLAGEAQGWLVAVSGHRDGRKRAALGAAGLEPRCAFRLRRLVGPAEDAAAVRGARPGDAEALLGLARRTPSRLHAMQLVWREPRSVEGYRALVERKDCATLVRERDGRVGGYALVKLGLPAPPVYDPGGSTAVLDELCAGAAGELEDLLRAAEAAGRAAGDVQLLVACAACEPGKRAALDARGYRWPVDWYSAPLPWRPAPSVRALRV